MEAELSGMDDTKVVRVFTNDLFTAVTVETIGQNLDTLNALSNVKRAWSSKTFPSAKTIKGPTFSNGAVIGAELYEIHSTTGVDKAHAAGVTGKGAVIAVVDTGTDHNHPALDGCFGPGCKVAAGYDYVGGGRMSPAYGRL